MIGTNGHHVGPDRPTLDAFVSALFRYADDGTFISLRAFDDSRAKGSPPILIDPVRIGDTRTPDWIFNRAKQVAQDARPGCFCPPVCTFTGRDKAAEGDIANGLTLCVECDANPAASRHKLAALLGEPTVTSASGGEWVNPETGELEPKLHLHWRLTEPTRDAAGHAQLKEARRLACHYVSADASAVPLNHPLRWPGSVHRKGEPKLARIVAQTENEVELAEALDKLRAACPDAPRREANQGASGAGVGLGPDLSGDLLDITAALSVIPNRDLPWDEWNRIAMAAWGASAGGAFPAFDAWSRRSPKYDSGVTAERWDHIGRHPPANIGAGSLYFLAQQAAPGWRKPSSWARDASRQPPILEQDAAPQADTPDADKPKGKAKASRSRKAPAQRDENDARPVIRLQAGELSRTVDAAEAALIAADCGVYQRSGIIVGVGTTPMLTAHRKAVLTPAIAEMGEHRLVELMMDAAAFEKWDARADGYVPTNAPMMIPKTLRERKGKLRLPVLSGLINAPTMRDDGSLIEAPGYDAATGLLYDPAGATFPPVPNAPGRRQAETALAQVAGLVTDFPFVSEADRSVALAAILTAVVRKSLGTAPAFAFTAPVAGSGKSKLVDILSVLATGKEAGVIALGSNPEESEKRIASLLLTGSAVAIDNVEGGLGGDLLCQTLTQMTVRARVLGRSETPELQTNVMVTATGNNMTVEGDMTRRTLMCRLDPKVERPELREFAFEPVAMAKAERGALVVAALTVLRAYHIAGRPAQTTPLGSFEDWSDLVRSALLWLGHADPVGTLEQARAEDPKLGRLRAVLEQWRAVLGSEVVTANDAVQRASAKSANVFEGGRAAFLHPEFREALLAVAGSNGFVDTGKLGLWLSRNKGRVIDGMHLEPMPETDGVRKWSLVAPVKQARTTYADRRDDYAEAGYGRTRF